MIALRPDVVVVIGLGILVVLTVAFVLFRRLPRRLKRGRFQVKWRELQLYCKDKSTWALAIITADKLLDSALKKRRFKGKSMGERLVSAQRLFSDNDGVWFGHKLRMQLEQHPDLKLKEADVKEVLMSIRQALKDLGALNG